MTWRRMAPWVIGDRSPLVAIFIAIPRSVGPVAA